MSRHSVTTTTTSGDPAVVAIGYDRPLDYVFCTVLCSGDFIYSNLEDENASDFQDDVRYYEPVLASLGITIPEAMYAQVEHDKETREGNRVVTYDHDGNVTGDLHF